MTPKYDTDGRTVFVTETKLRKFVCHCRTNAQAHRLAERLNGAEEDKARLDWMEQFITFEPIHVAPEDTEYGAHVTGKFFTSLRLRAVRQKDATLRAAIDANQHLNPTPSPNR